jgi:hypothetical protein
VRLLLLLGVVGFACAACTDVTAREPHPMAETPNRPLRKDTGGKRAGYLLLDDLAQRTDHARRESGSDIPTLVQDDVFLFVAPDRSPLLQEFADYAHRVYVA